MSSTTVPPDHFVIDVEENHSYRQIIGNPNAPFINSPAAEGTLFTSSYAITRPSEPNYLALLSGSTQGVTDDGTHLFPTTPTLTITNTSLTVTAGGSVPLGITATPVDSDDTISVKIGGVPTYETVAAPGGDTVTSSLQADGTNTWTVTEGASTTGAPLTALTLSSSYTGSDHPVATFTVTASNTTSGETATSAAQTMTVIDPPAVTAGGGPSASPRGATVASTPNLGQIDRLVALMDQFTAAGFHEDQTGAGAITSMSGSNGSHEDLAFLATPYHHHA